MVEKGIEYLGLFRPITPSVTPTSWASSKAIYDPRVWVVMFVTVSYRTRAVAATVRTVFMLSDVLRREILLPDVSPGTKEVCMGGWLGVCPAAGTPEAFKVG